MTEPTRTEPGPSAAAAGVAKPPTVSMRKMPWTKALWIVVAAFALWLVLDAPTLQHNAQVSPVGTRRTVALDLLGPIASLSRTIGLSHVVSVGNGVIGRNGNRPGSGQFISVGPGDFGGPNHHHGSPPTGGPPAGGGPASWTWLAAVFPPPAAPSGPLAIASPTSANPLRVLVVGDSLGIDLGDSLVQDLLDTGVVAATLDGVQSTGLTRPDYYNWPSELSVDLAKLKPQVVVVMIGANDPQDLPGPPDIEYASASWDATYGQRVGAFIREAASDGAKVIWVGMPPMKDPGRSAAMEHIDQLDAAQAQTQGVPFVDTWTVLGGTGGQYTPFLVSTTGQEINIREPDGIHISPGGGEVLSQSVINTIRTALHIALPPT